MKNSRENIYLDDVDGAPEVEATDPYEVFGFGVLAYFSMLRFLMVSMAMMTIVMFPTIRTYSQGAVMENNYDDFLSSSKISIGNLGQAQPICIHQYVSLNFSQSLICPKGEMTNLYYFGIIPGEPFYLDNQAYCGVMRNISSINDCTTKFLNGNLMANDFV